MLESLIYLGYNYYISKSTINGGYVSNIYMRN
jgi:hypothetical protein